jgi:hypothetical protein
MQVLASGLLWLSQAVSVQASPPATQDPTSSVAKEGRTRMPLRCELCATQNTWHPREPRLTTQSERHWFRGPLAASYLGPVAGLSFFALGLSNESFIFPGIVGVLGVSAPTLVHVAHDDAIGGFYAFLGMFTSAGVGAFAGYAIGHIAPGGLTKSEAAARDGAMLAIVGYAIWAVLDIAFFAYHDERQ